MSLRIYLSGPMKGYDESNYPAFEAATQTLRAAGHHVYSPHEFMPAGKPSVADLRRAFAAYCKFICEEADTIVLLPGWEKSLGVSAELALAKNCDLAVFEFPAVPATRAQASAANAAGDRQALRASRIPSGETGGSDA